MMKTIYLAYSDTYGEDVEGMYDADGNLLDLWACNDASWRGEYFDTFMEALGIKVKPAGKSLLKKFDQDIKDAWGMP